MIDESAAVLPIWMLLSAAAGFMLGEAIGDSRRHRKCLDETNDDLRDQLQKARAACKESLHQELKRLRGEINDIHKHVLAVSKGLEKRPS